MTKEAKEALEEPLYIVLNPTQMKNKDLVNRFKNFVFKGRKVKVIADKPCPICARRKEEK